MNFQCWQFGHGKNPRVGQKALGLENIVKETMGDFSYRMQDM